MDLGYVYIIVNPADKSKIYINHTIFLPRKVIIDYREETGIDDAEMEWFLSLPDSKLSLNMIEYKLRQFRNPFKSHIYNIHLDVALSYFLKDIVDFFELFKTREKINWRIDQFVTYQELCAKTQLELLYPLLHRNYIRNKLAILRRNQGLPNQ